MNVKNEAGVYTKDSYCAPLARNPVATLHEKNFTSKNNLLTAHLDLKVKLLPGLTFTTTNGIDYKDAKDYSFISLAAQAGNNKMSNAATERMTLQSSNNLTYNGQWGKHNLTATGVWEATTSTFVTMGFDGINLPVESVGWYNVSLAGQTTPNNNFSSWTLLSGVGRVMYNYDNRYMVTGTFRADGSSKFTNNKWGFFPSVAFAWQLGNEKFMQQQDIFSDVKIRTSAGVVGSQAINPYETLGLMQEAKYSFDTPTNYTGYWIGTSTPTPDLTWEKTYQFDAGVDFSVLDGRVSASLDYFYKRTKDGLLKKNVPDYDGGGTVWINAGEISNTGLEFTIDARIIDTKDLFWSSSLNGTFLKNKVENLGGLSFIVGQSPMGGVIPADGVNRIMEGYPVGSFYVYEWAGLDENGRDTYKDNDDQPGFSGNDRVMKGQATPKLTLGWNNTITYKNWDFNAFFSAAFGASKLNLLRFIGGSMNGESVFYTLSESIDNCFGNSPNAIFPAPSVTDNNFQAGSTKWLEKADYLRLENLSIAYNISRKHAKFADIKLYLSAQNLFTLTGYKGIDPAGVSMMRDEYTDTSDGIDIGAYPLSKIYTFGVKFNF